MNRKPLIQRIDEALTKLYDGDTVVVSHPDGDVTVGIVKVDASGSSGYVTKSSNRYWDVGQAFHIPKNTNWEIQRINSKRGSI